MRCALQFVTFRKNEQVILSDLMFTPPKTTTTIANDGKCSITWRCGADLIKPSVKTRVADNNISGYQLFHASDKASDAQQPEIEIPVLHLVDKLFKVIEMCVECYLHNNLYMFCGNLISAHINSC